MSSKSKDHDDVIREATHEHVTALSRLLVQAPTQSAHHWMWVFGEVLAVVIDVGIGVPYRGLHIPELKEFASRGIKEVMRNIVYYGRNCIATNTLSKVADKIKPRDRMQ